MHAPSAHSRLLKQYPREGGREGCGGKIPKTRPLNTSALRIHPPYFLSSFLPIARLSFESLPPPLPSFRPVVVFLLLLPSAYLSIHLYISPQPLSLQPGDGPLYPSPLISSLHPLTLYEYAASTTAIAQLDAQSDRSSIVRDDTRKRNCV